MDRHSLWWMAGLAWLGALTLPGAQGQPAKPPDAYSLTEINAMMGPNMTMKIARDGSRAVVETTMATPAGQPPKPGSHTKVYYDFQAHKNYTWNADDPAGVCSRGDFSGDWGDPFETAAQLMKELAPQNPKQTGVETVNGFSTKAMVAGTGTDQTKFWVDAQSGLLIKVQSSGQTALEIKQMTVTKPAPAVFTLPAKCGSGPPTGAERISADTSSNSGDFLDAMKTGGSGDACSVVLRVVQAGTMQPIVSGFQMAIDTQVDPDHLPKYNLNVGPAGHATFSGGALHEVTGQLRDGRLRIENAPPQFEVFTHFNPHFGNASALIYRHCVAPATVLLLVVKDPTKVGQGVDWLWVKSGKFAAGN